MWLNPVQSTQTASDDYSQTYIANDDALLLRNLDETGGTISVEHNALLSLSGWGSILVSGATVVIPHSATLQEMPNASTIAVLRNAEENYSQGNTSPAFETGEEAVAWLDEQGI